MSNTNLTAATYTVAGTPFDSFMKAIELADSLKVAVVEVATGKVRWTPGKVSAKARRMYQERLAAYQAQEAARGAASERI